MVKNLHIFRVAALSALFWVAGWLPAGAALSDRYTDERPLVIVSDRDFQPFEYMNANGMPEGYNIDLLGRIFKKLGVSYTFVMREWYQAVSTFMQRDADLIFMTNSVLSDSSQHASVSTVSYYKLAVVCREDVPALSSLSQLHKGDTIVLKEGDYATALITPEKYPDLTILFNSPREAMSGLVNGHFRYYIWGEAPLSHKQDELVLNDLVLGEIDLPAGEFHVVGYDKELVDAIDDQMARLEQSGELKVLRDKWFHPERTHDNTSPVVLVFLAGALLVGVVGFVLNRLIKSRVRTSFRRANDQKNMMEQALAMGQLYVMEYDLARDRAINQYGDMLPAEGLSSSEFMECIHPDERDGLNADLQRLRSGEIDRLEIRKRWNAGTAEEPVWKYLYGHCMTEREGGKPRYIIASIADLTTDVLDERHDSEQASKYRSMFDSNLVAMSFYTADGTLVDLNDKMRQLCGFDDAGEQFFRQTNLFEADFFKNDLPKGMHDVFHACQHMYYPALRLDKYLELRIRPTFDDGNRLAYYILTTRDVTEERLMYLNQAKSDTELRRVSKEVDDYEHQLEYLLTNSNMFVFQTDVGKRMIYFSRSLRRVDYSWAFEDYVKSMYEEDRFVASDIMYSPKRIREPFNVVHHFHYTPVSPDPCWYAVSSLPVFDADGELTGHFGVVRNVTKLMEAQEQLRRETARAEDSGRMKSAFLANMTHEIRTPLNAIVGFSDLLQVVDEPAERQEFIRIIRNNCDMLLRLINDILETSDASQKPLAVTPADVDFAVAFDDICQSLEQRVDNPDVKFLKENPYKSFPTRLDKGRIQQVITNFVTNAVKYTRQGHIKVGYRYEKAGLYIYCEDTGAGIPKEKQASVFDRFVKLNDFVQGTGLGLSICRSIAKRCDGRIGVTSEGEGHGSTFWIWIPCIISQPPVAKDASPSE